MVRITQLVQTNSQVYLITPHDLPTGITLPYEVTPAWVQSAYEAARTDASQNARDLDVVSTWEGTWQITEGGTPQKMSSEVQPAILDIDVDTLKTEMAAIITSGHASYLTSSSDPGGGSSPNNLYNQQYWLEGLRVHANVTQSEDTMDKLQALIENVCDSGTTGNPSGTYYGWAPITSSLSGYQWAHSVVKLLDDMAEGRVPVNKDRADWAGGVIVWINDNIVAQWHLQGEVTNWNNRLDVALADPPTDVTLDKIYHAIAVDSIIEKMHSSFEYEVGQIGATYTVKSGGNTFNRVQTGTAVSSGRNWRNWHTRTFESDGGIYDYSNGDARWEENNLNHSHYETDGDHPYWDTAHANRFVEYADSMQRAKLLDLTEHIGYLAKTFTNRMWNGSGSPDVRFSNYIDGDTTVYLSGTHGTDGVASMNAILHPGWTLLGAYDPLALYLLNEVDDYVDLAVNDSGMYQRMSANAAKLNTKANLAYAWLNKGY